MAIVDGETFKSANGFAVRLPREVAFSSGIDVTIERNGDVLTIRPANDVAADTLVATCKANGHGPWPATALA